MTVMPPIVVIAGGLATRMWPLTEVVPKSLLPVAGEPFIAHQLKLFRREGVERAVICVGHLGEQIEAFVGNGDAFGVNVSYSRDGMQRLGTGGAVRKAMRFVGEASLVIYGDSYLDIEFAPVVEAFRRQACPALMTVLHNAGRWDTSNVEFVDGRIVEYSKQPTPRMRHIDYGLAMMSSDVFAGTCEGEIFDLSVIFRRLVAAGALGGYGVSRRFYEIGSPSGLAETEAYLRDKARERQA